MKLFQRPPKMQPCPKSTVLFASFAQWFVDGFLVTWRLPAGGRDALRNHSGHDIDLAQLYGRTDAVTDALRAKDGGRLRSIEIRGEEYPEYLCERGRPKREFAALPKPLGFDDMTPAERNRLFAMGGDPVSLGFTAFNVLFLREHNRIAGELGVAHPGWGDERLFKTARNVLTVVLLKIVVEDYINHISGVYFRFQLPRRGEFSTAPWMRPNWMAIEFDLLYRWHSLLPKRLQVGAHEIPIKDSLGRTDILTEQGLRTFMLDASAQRAGRVSLFNTDEFLVSVAERPTVEAGRRAQLRSFNDYRELCGLPRLKNFGQFSTSKKVGKRLCKLVRPRRRRRVLRRAVRRRGGPLRGAAAADDRDGRLDAFSQALMNPLLGPQMDGELTFSQTGLDIIADTKNLESVIRRNVGPCLDDDYFSLTRKGYVGPSTPVSPRHGRGLTVRRRTSGSG